MIKMARVYGDMYVPREYCTFTNPVTKKNIMLIWQNIHLIGRRARSFIDQHTRQES